MFYSGVSSRSGWITIQTVFILRLQDKAKYHFTHCTSALQEVSLVLLCFPCREILKEISKLEALCIKCLEAVLSSDLWHKRMRTSCFSQTSLAWRGSNYLQIVMKLISNTNFWNLKWALRKCSVGLD